MITPQKSKLFIEEVRKENLPEQTASGLYVPSKGKDSHDNALLRGEVIETESDGFIKGSIVWFNRYNAFIVVQKGIKTYWVVDEKDVWCTGEI